MISLLAQTRPFKDPRDISISCWLDSCYNAKWCTLMTVGIKGEDFATMHEEVSEEFWELYGYMKRG